MRIQVKRVYEPTATSDAFRMLVDRVWPRGLSKSDAKLDLWLPDLGPSTALRQWFNHDPIRWAEFQRRYHAELKNKTALLATITEQAKTSSVTLLYSSKDERHNQAVALRSFLLKRPATRNPITIKRQNQRQSLHAGKAESGAEPMVTISIKKKAMTRCPWAGDKPHMMHYHDREWGRPVHSDRRLFEVLLLEGAQAGLTWDTVLKRRENYRKAFDGFDPAKVAKFTTLRKKQLLGDPGIIRNRLKIDAAVTNAQTFLAVQKEFGSFDRYVWQFVGGKPKLNRWRTMADVPATSPESDALSKDLKKRGFRFVGSTIVYAFMQAVGMVDDHLNGCFAKTRTNISALSVG